MPQPARASTTQESSVLFNLQELMRIEDERVQAEADAERALRQAAQAQAEQEQRKADELRAQQRAAIEAEQQAREQAKHDAEQRMETQRQLALLQARLRTEAEDRATREQRLLLVEANAQREQAQARHRARMTWLTCMLVVSVGCSVLGYTQVIAPRMERAAVESRVAAERADRAVDQLAALRAQLREMTTASAVSSAAAKAPASAVSASLATTERSNARGGKRTHAGPHETTRDRQRATPVGDMDELDTESSDPLIGLR